MRAFSTHSRRRLITAGFGLALAALALAGLAFVRPASARPFPEIPSSRALSLLAAATAPETTITSAPAALVNSRNASIEFTSDNSLATFECSLDGSTFAACFNPRPVLNKPDGLHVFRVRAVAGGLADPTPAETSWTIDATAPAVTVTPSRPADGKGWYRSSVSFTTAGTDAGGPVVCTDAQTYSGPDVSHLSIVGTCTDPAGNTTKKTFDLRYDATYASPSAYGTGTAGTTARSTSRSSAPTPAAAA
jgi:large repetitive protein